MKILAKYHVCNHCVIGEKAFKNILIGPGKFRDFREMRPSCLQRLDKTSNWLSW